VTGTVDGYKFTIEGKSNQDATPRTMNVVSFNALITNVGGEKTSFSYYVADTPFKKLASSPIYLTASIFTNSNGIYNKGDGAQTQGYYQSLKANGSVDKSYLTSTAKVTGTNQNVSSNTIKITDPGVGSTVSDIGGVVYTSGKKNTKLQFFSQAVVSMAEPTGVLIGLLSLPCMGLVVFLARRPRFLHAGRGGVMVSR
jgi:hypothetical protein